MIFGPFEKMTFYGEHPLLQIQIRRIPTPIYNFAVGIPNGGITIINAIQLGIEKYITSREKEGQLPTRAAVFFGLSNMFNNISRVKFFDIIATSFPELLPLTKLFYSNPGGNVFHKWVDGEWKIRRVITRMPIVSCTIAALVVVHLLKPIDQSLRQRALQRLRTGILHDDYYGGRTHLLGFIDDKSTLVPLKDLLFLCEQFQQRGIPLG